MEIIRSEQVSMFIPTSGFHTPLPAVGAKQAETGFAEIKLLPFGSSVTLATAFK